MAKSLQETSAKWSRRAGSASQEYTDGVNSPRRSWATATKNAEANYEQGVQQSIAAKRFGKGVDKAGDAKWKSRAVELGGARFSSGVAASQNEYERGFAPYASVLASLQLPPKGAKGSPNNIQRVATVANALRSAKVGK